MDAGILMAIVHRNFLFIVQSIVIQYCPETYFGAKDGDS